MNWWIWVWHNIERSAFRSWIVLLSAALVTFFAVTATSLVGGARASLSLARARLGADLIVVPQGAGRQMENAFLMSAPVSLWMPAYVADETAQIEGVAAVSPQLFLFTLRGATCCAVPEMFMVAYDPVTDFTLRPWLSQHLAGGLGIGEAIGGSYVFVPSGAAKILVYNYPIDLRGNLEPTGTGLDQTMFFTFATAAEISRLSEVQAEQKLNIPPDSVSAVLIRTLPGYDTSAIARQIQRTIPDVEAIESINLFASQRSRLDSVLKASLALLFIIAVLSVMLMALVFSIMINERRREIGVLRALGARQTTVSQSLLTEAAFLALVGGGLGTGLALMAVSLLRGPLIAWLGAPFLAPSLLTVFLMIGEGLALSLFTVMPAAWMPARRLSQMEPAQVMRA